MTDPQHPRPDQDPSAMPPADPAAVPVEPPPAVSSEAPGDAGGQPARRTGRARVALVAAAVVGLVAVGGGGPRRSCHGAGDGVHDHRPAVPRGRRADGHPSRRRPDGHPARPGQHHRRHHDRRDDVRPPHLTHARGQELGVVAGHSAAGVRTNHAQLHTWRSRWAATTPRLPPAGLIAAAASSSCLRRREAEARRGRWAFRGSNAQRSRPATPGWLGCVAGACRCCSRGPLLPAVAQPRCGGGVGAHRRGGCAVRRHRGCSGRHGRAVFGRVRCQAGVGAGWSAWARSGVAGARLRWMRRSRR